MAHSKEKSEKEKKKSRGRSRDDEGKESSTRGKEKEKDKDKQNKSKSSSSSSSSSRHRRLESSTSHHSTAAKGKEVYETYRPSSSRHESSGEPSSKRTRLASTSLEDFVLWRDEKEGRRSTTSRWEFSRLDDDARVQKEKAEAEQAAIRRGFGRGYVGPFQPTKPPPGSNFKQNFRIFPSRLKARPTNVLLAHRWERMAKDREATKEEPSSVRKAANPFHREPKGAGG